MQYPYKQFMRTLSMSEMVWKCFRCNLSFKDKELAEMHEKIENHSTTKIKTLVA